MRTGIFRVESGVRTKISYKPKEKVSIQKVEIVVPAVKSPRPERIAMLIAKTIALLTRTLLVFWFVAGAFGEYGWTFWQLLLPVYIASNIFVPIAVKGRWIPANRLGKVLGELPGTTELVELARARKN